MQRVPGEHRNKVSAKGLGDDTGSQMGRYKLGENRGSSERIGIGLAWNEDDRGSPRGQTCKGRTADSQFPQRADMQREDSRFSFPPEGRQAKGGRGSARLEG